MAPNEQQVMEQVKAELANAYLQSVRDKCFDKCVTRPGTSMSKSEISCLANCCDRYIDATKVVSGTVLATYKAAAQGGLPSGGLQ